MALSEKSIQHIMGLYAANWVSLKQTNGLDEYLRWFGGQDIDEWCVNEAMRRIIKKRMDDGKLDPMKDKPRLIELQKVYFDVLNEKRDTEIAEEVIDDCAFCLNFGYRWVVVHFDSYMKSEVPITAIPENTSEIKKFVNKYSLPCTCKRGINYKNHIIESMKKDSRYFKPVEYDKQSRILNTYSMPFEQAQKLINDYTRVRNAIFFPKTKKEQNEARVNRDYNYKTFMKAARQRIPEEVRKEIIERKKQEQEQEETSDERTEEQRRNPDQSRAGMELRQ
jgi:hypothetical protein